MKILNLYSGIGGNRKLWGNEHDITAVEIDPEIAKVYSDYFPDDKMVIGDAHQYLLDHFKEFDFIWSSPPCPSHSRARFWGFRNTNPVYPDMSLYEEILFLKHYYDGLWLVENVSPFYDPLIRPARKIGRHLFWSNFRIPDFQAQEADITRGNRADWTRLHGISIDGYKFKARTNKILRNCVHPETGLYILECATGLINSKSEQGTLFEAIP